MSNRVLFFMVGRLRHPGGGLHGGAFFLSALATGAPSTLSTRRGSVRSVELVLGLRWLHLVAAATWTGGLIVLAALVVALRRAGASRELLQAAARQFGRVSWAAMAIAIATGLTQLHFMGISWSHGPLHLKLGLVALVIVLALGHQLTARRSSPAARGVVQLLILVASLGVFWAAVRL
jgi:uncharacterized membrane protein